MNNIPENILQAVADASFLYSTQSFLTCSSTSAFWESDASSRRAVIQRALSDPTLAPFLAALPRRESQALAQAIARVEKAEAELTAQVPLGPEDVPPGSVFTFGAKALWITPLCVSSDGVGFPETEPDKPLIQKFSFELLQEVAKINTSIPDTGRWDENAWRPCSKPGKEFN